MKFSLTLPLALLLASSACNKDDTNKDAPAAAKTAATTSIESSGANTATKVGLDTGGKALGGDATRLQALKFGGEGFEGEYNEALDSWHFEKWEEQSDGSNDNVVSVYLDNFDAEWPKDMEAFASKLQEPDFLDYGYSWTKIAAKTSTDSGWSISGELSDGEETEASFALYNSSTQTLCRGTVKPTAADTEASIKESIAACKAASL